MAGVESFQKEFVHSNLLVASLIEFSVPSTEKPKESKESSTLSIHLLSKVSL